MAVVAVLGVVVVLDHQRAGVARPGGQRGPPRRLEHDAGGRLVGGRDEHGVGARRDDGADVDAALVDRDRHDLDPAVADQLARARVARVLDRDPPRAAGAQHAADERHRLGDAAADHDPLGRRLHAADAAQVGGQRGAQPRVPAGRRVAEVGVGHLAQRAPLGRGPGRAREERQVRGSGPQVVARRRRRRLGRAGGGDRRPRGHARRGAAVDREIALGRELPVRLHHHPARDAELGRQRAARGQPVARRQPPGAHAVAQLRLELRVQRPRAAPHGDEQLARTGPVHLPHSGPVQRTRCNLRSVTCDPPGSTRPAPPPAWRSSAPRSPCSTRCATTRRRAARRSATRSAPRSSSPSPPQGGRPPCSLAAGLRAGRWPASARLGCGAAGGAVGAARGEWAGGVQPARDGGRGEHGSRQRGRDRGDRAGAARAGRPAAGRAAAGAAGGGRGGRGGRRRGRRAGARRRGDGGRAGRRARRAGLRGGVLAARGAAARAARGRRRVGLGGAARRADAARHRPRRSTGRAACCACRPPRRRSGWPGWRSA